MLTRATALVTFLAFLFIPILAMAAPSITSLSPTSGGAGTSVTITGSGFGTTQGTSTVKFNGTTATTITLWSATSIKAAVPTGATTGNIVVTVGGVVSNGKPFTVTAPSITTLSPVTGGAGISVTITGTGFGTSQSTSSVQFNGTTATTITSWSATSIKAAVPTGATTGNVIVTVGGMASAGKPFTVTAPSITSLSPTSGAVGASVTITGTGFGTTQAGSSVQFNGTSATTINSWSATSINASVPTAATTGNVVVIVGGMASNGKSFTVKPTPSIASLSPTFGAVGISVTISGANFGTTQGTSTVKFNGVTATPTSWGASQIVVPVPSGASTGNVVVNTSGVNTNGINFTVLTISSISVTPANLSLPLNSIQQYTATAIYSDNSTQNLGANATWSSSDTTIAAINTTGVATCPGQGQATIQASFGTFIGSTSMTVTGSSFFPVGNLITPRIGHTATLLANGKVLIVGGQHQNSTGSNEAIASSELYDPATGMFTATGSLAQARTSHTATLLADGKVLIAGGYYYTPNGELSLSSSELYDPATGAFDPNSASRMNSDHYSHTATLLNDGRILIAGGNYIIPNFGGGPSPAELYDPSTGTFTLTAGDLTTARSSHTATLLNDGTVLIAGGSNSYSLAGSEIYDPATDAFTPSGSMATARDGHTATPLSNGKVMIAGGLDDCASPCTNSYLSSVEVYDPATRLFVLTGSLSLARGFHSASLLNNGTVLIVGGGNFTGSTGTAELFDSSSQIFTGAGSLITPRGSHTATLLNDGTVLIVGGEDFNMVSQAEIYSSTPPVPNSLQITPATSNMLVGDARQFTALDNLGRPRPDATWTVSDTSLASITASGSATLTAIAPGTLSITATVDAISAQAQVTILAAGALTPGTALWSVPPVPGFSPLQLLQAVPTDSGPDLYSTQLSADGTQTIVQALTADGRQLWQTSLPAVNGNSVPDGSGGLLVTEHNTCLPGQTDPMTVVDLDGLTGQPKWQIAAAGVQNGNSILYCYPDTIKAMEPQIAIRGDGSVFISAMTNNGLPPLTVNGTNIAVPASTSTDSSGRQFADFSPLGPPIVNSDGFTYIEYEVRQIAYPPRITSAFLYLMKIAPNNSSTSITLSSTTQDTNLLPGRIIPDGQGGVLATWTIAPANPPSPTHPYQASHVVAGVPGTPYDLPFTPNTTAAGTYPELLLGENGNAFATDGSDSTNGPQIVNFGLDSGIPNWSYQGQAQDAFSFVAAVAGGGVAAKRTNSGDALIHIDPSGIATVDPPMALSGSDYWTLGRFLGFLNSGFQMAQGVTLEVSMNAWPFEKGSRNKNSTFNVPQVVDYLPSYIELDHSDPLTTGKFSCSTDQKIRNQVGKYSDSCAVPSDPTARVNQLYKTRQQATVQAFRADVNKPLDALAFFGHSSVINDGMPQVFSVGINFYYPIAPGMNPGDTATWDHDYFPNDVIGSGTPTPLSPECFPQDGTCGTGPNPIVNKLLPLEKDATTVQNLGAVWQYGNDEVTTSNDPPPAHRSILLADKLVQQAKILFFAACDLKPPLAQPGEVPVFLQLWDIHDAQFDFAETRQRAIIVPNGNSTFLEDSADAWQTILSDMILQSMTVQQAVADANSKPGRLQQFVVYGNPNVKLK
jgi:hypothetical protein